MTFVNLAVVAVVQVTDACRECKKKSIERCLEHGLIRRVEPEEKTEEVKQSSNEEFKQMSNISAQEEVKESQFVELKVKQPMNLATFMEADIKKSSVKEYS